MVRPKKIVVPAIVQQPVVRRESFTALLSNCMCTEWSVYALNLGNSREQVKVFGPCSKEEAERISNQLNEVLKCGSTLG